MRRNKTKYKVCSLLLCLCTVMYLLITPWPGISFTDTKDALNEIAEVYVAGITKDGGVTKYYTSLQAAIGEVANGETISLLSDTVENIESADKSYTLEMNEHRIDGNKNGRVYNISGGTVTLKNGTLTNGYANKFGALNQIGGGLNISNASVILDNMTVTGNTASSNGGGVYFNGGDLTVINSKISNNTAANNGSGGGVYSKSGKITVDTSTISDNTAAYQGGGIYSADIVLTNVIFKQNTSKSGGVALYISRAGKAAVNDCTFNDNHGSDPNAAESSIITAGDDLGTTGGTVEFNRCNIIGNDNVEHAICFSNAEYGYGYKSINVTFTDCVISDNTALYTGGIRLGDYSIVTLNNTVVKDNTAFGTGTTFPLVGGISIHNSVDNSFTLNSGAVYGNNAENGNANDLYVGEAATVEIIAAHDMKDTHSEETVVLSNYVWRMPDGKFIDEAMSGQYARDRSNLLLTAFDVVNPPTALYNGVEYDSVREAIEAAKKAGIAPAEIKLLPGKNRVGERVITSFYIDGVTVDFPIKLDTGKCSLNTKDDALFTVTEEGSLTLSGTGTLNGLIYVENASTLTLDTDINGDLYIRLGDKGSVVALGDDFVSGGRLNIELDEARATELTTANRSADDISRVIISGVGDKHAVSDVELTYNGKPLVNIYPLVKIMAEGDDIVAVNPTIINDLFVSGSKGNDVSYDGSDEQKALKTVDAAIKKMKDKQSGGTIYLLDAVVINGDDVRWTGNDKGITIMRYSKDMDIGEANMVTVKSGSLTLEKITLDGGCKNTNYTNCGSIIKVESGAELILGDGAKLTNNNVITNIDNDGWFSRKDGYAKHSGGAAFIAQGGTVTIKEGSAVTDCKAMFGGGIYCENGTVIMTGGTFENNTADGKMMIDDKSHHTASGGGIVITGKNCKMEMSGGTFINNTAIVGGGLSIGTGDYTLTREAPLTVNYSAEPDSDTVDWAFIMTGGTFTENISSSEGGAMFVQSTYKAQITSGEFSENTCKGGNYGGGAIYVNGGKEGYPDGELWLRNVLIHNNDAKRYGGGIAGCNTSGTVINAQDGSVIYGNIALYGTEDIPCDISSATSPTIVNQFTGDKHPQTVDYFTQYMVDGTPYHWQFAMNTFPYNEGDYAPEDYLDSTSGKILYTASLPKDGTEESMSVKIINNHSLTCGGGIGTNGSVFIGKPFVTNTQFKLPDEFEVTKKWQDENGGNKRPSDVDQIKIWILKIDDENELSYIHKLMKKTNGNWEETLGFDELGADIAAAVVMEEVIYADGTHVWSVSDEDRVKYNDAIEKVFKDIVETMYLNEKHIWSYDASSPFTSKFEEDGNGNFTVTNILGDRSKPNPGSGSGSNSGSTPEPEVKPVPGPELIGISVTKIWDDDHSINRPESVAVQLYRNNDAYGEPVILSKENNWNYTCDDLDATYNWTVEEIDVPDGYEVSITHEGTDWTVTNTKRKTDASDPNDNSSGDPYSPNTGVDPISFGVIMIIISLISVLAGKVFSQNRG